jgi:hypothetical protein
MCCSVVEFLELDLPLVCLDRLAMSRRMIGTVLYQVVVVAASIFVFRWLGASWKWIAVYWVAFGLLFGGFMAWRNVLKSRPRHL